MSLQRLTQNEFIKKIINSEDWYMDEEPANVREVKLFVRINGKDEVYLSPDLLEMDHDTYYNFYMATFWLHKVLTRTKNMPYNETRFV